MSRTLLLCALCSLWTRVDSLLLPPSHRHARLHTKVMARDNKDDISPSNLDRLREEAENPFRTFRLFLYGAAGANAAIGGFTSLAQLAGTLSDAPSALPLDQVTQNLGVDFGVVAAAAVLFSLDKAGQESQVAEYASQDATPDKKEKSKLSKDAMVAREAVLKQLSLDVVVGAQSGSRSSTGSSSSGGGGESLVETRCATVRELQEGAGQNVVVVAGTEAVLREALVRAMILGTRFAKQSILIVPVPVDSSTGSLLGAGVSSGSGSSMGERGKRGFGRSAWEEKPYVAKVANSSGEGSEESFSSWATYLDSELSAAATQAGVTAAEVAAQGIVIVMNQEGSIVRRGLGAPAWDMIINEDLGK